MNVYVSIGNSDDKLTQQKWVEFYHRTSVAIIERASAVHGRWMSEPSSVWQNACWCVELDTPAATELRVELRALAAQFGQDSIAWSVAETELLTPDPA